MISIELQDVTKKPIKNTLFLFIFLSSENLKIELLIDNATIGINKLIVAKYNINFSICFCTKYCSIKTYHKKK